MNHGHRTLMLAVLLFMSAAGALAQDDPASQLAYAHLTIGTKVTEPFVIREANGTYTGLSIELLAGIAEDLGFTFTLREYEEVPELLSAVVSGEVDAGMSAVTVTADRERVIDFTHPFHTDGLGIAVPREPAGGTLLTAARAIVSSQFVQVIAVLAFVLLGVGVLVWLAERRTNKEQFGGSVARGVASGFW